MTSSFDLEAFLPYQLAVLASRISRDFAKVYSAEFGISVAEWRVIAHLAQSGTASVREIHARVDMDKSRVSRAAERLAAAGLIDKRASAADRRLLDLSLSAEGRALFARIVPLAREFEAGVLGRLDPATSAAFRQAVDALNGRP